LIRCAAKLVTGRFAGNHGHRDAGCHYRMMPRPPDARKSDNKRRPSLLMPCGVAGIAVGKHEGRHVLQHARMHAAETVGADAHELVHAGEAAEDGEVADMDVAGQLGVVGENGVLPTWQSCARCT
jgi:hypothetical protein